MHGITIECLVTAMAVRVISPLLLLVALGVIAGVIALLANPRTRVAGGVVVAVVSGLVVLFFFARFAVVPNSYVANDYADRAFQESQRAMRENARAIDEAQRTAAGIHSDRPSPTVIEHDSVSGHQTIIAPGYVVEGQPYPNVPSPAWQQPVVIREGYGAPSSWLILLGVVGAAIVIVLLVNPRTRPLMKTILGLAVIGAGLAAWFLLDSRQARDVGSVQQTRHDTAIAVHGGAPEPGSDLDRFGQSPVIHPEADKTPEPASKPKAAKTAPPAAAKTAKPAPAVGKTAAAPLKTAEAAPKSAPKRPDWVDRAPWSGDDADGGFCAAPVTSDIFATRQECEDELTARCRNAVEQYLSDKHRLGSPAAVQRLSPEFIRARLVKERWQEVVESKSVGPMLRLHALLVFDRHADAELEAVLGQAVVRDRLAIGGGLLAVLLTLVAAVWGYLKVDLATAGRYRKRLRLAAVIAILAVVLAGLGLIWA
jgi:hypothetical protein